jgi:hypothetical protein
MDKCYLYVLQRINGAKKYSVEETSNRMKNLINGRKEQ